MPGLPQLVLALDILTEGERRSALLLLITSWVKTSYPEEGYAEWVLDGPPETLEN
ncbi:MAG TPA: hypothetical protein VH063_19710 [Gaiellaceae bacterium]|jgi:hypothetical protein|nr:hypothetical protein [Gaiellaceae bacterium]